MSDFRPYGWLCADQEDDTWIMCPHCGYVDQETCDYPRELREDGDVATADELAYRRAQIERLGDEHKKLLRIAEDAHAQRNAAKAETLRLIQHLERVRGLLPSRWRERAKEHRLGPEAACLADDCADELEQALDGEA